MKTPEIINEQFIDRLKELEIYYNNHDDLGAGVFLINKKYWYLWHGKIQYGYVSTDSYKGIRDVSCKNRITFLEQQIPIKSFKNIRVVPKHIISDDKKTIVKHYVKYLKDKDNTEAYKKLEKITMTYPEWTI